MGRKDLDPHGRFRGEWVKFAFMNFPLLDMCLVAPVLTGHPQETDQWPLNNTKLNIILKVACSIQGSYRFLDKKFNFFQNFFLNNIFFSRLKVIKQVINIDLEKNRRTFFARCTANIQARLNKIFIPKGKQIHF